MIMADKDVDGLAALSEMAGNLPAPVSAGFVKAISGLLGGLTLFPTAWFRRPAQAVDDTTAARSTVAAILAKGVAENALQDPVVMQAAAEIYMPNIIRKARNKVQVAQLAIEHASENEAGDADAVAPDDDWMNAFIRFSEDASSERLQDMFGRILAGQVVRPGSFTLATLRIVAELDQSVAQDFSLAWERSVGTAVDYSSDFQLGDWFARWKRLAEVGLMADSHTIQFLPEYNPKLDGNSLWSPMVAGKSHLLVHFPKNCTANWKHIDFTRVGCQIGSILAPPDYEANMRNAGKRLVDQGVSRVELYTSGKSPELL
jgi:hypothetical protein